MSELDNQPALTGSFQQSTIPFASETPINIPVLEPEEVILEMGDSFDLEGFQIVRKEFFAHLREPSVSFNNCKFSVNSASGASYTTNAALALYAIYTSSTTTTAVTLPTPTRSGYNFMGWATSSTATSGTTGSYTPSGNVTLYAIWGAKGLVYIGNGNHRETRRHCSLDALNLDDALLPSDVDVFEAVADTEGKRNLYQAINKLSPQQRKVICQVSGRFWPLLSPWN